VKAIDNIGNVHFRVFALQPAAAASTATRRTNGSDITDTVELSQTGPASCLSREFSCPKLERIIAVHEAIQDGTFETPERIEGTVDRLLDLLA